MRRALLLSSLLCAAPCVAQDRTHVYQDAADQLSRALAVVAADRGEAEAFAAAGPLLPARLRPALRKIAGSPRAVDLRELGDDMELKGAMLDELLVDEPEAKRALEGFSQDAGARLQRELTWFEGRTQRLCAAATALRTKVEGKLVVSRKDARREPEGKALLLYAAEAPLLMRHLSMARTATERYGIAGRLFDRPADALARSLLALLVRVSKTARAEGAGVGDPQALEAVATEVSERVARSLKSFERATLDAALAARLLRDEELRRVVQADRSPSFSEVVPRVKAYKKQFGEPPALQATATCDVYQDSRSARLAFWIEGEGRWVLGSERVDPIGPVMDALLGSRWSEHQRQSVNALALARLYGLFQAYAQEPFALGWKAFLARARSAAERAADLRRVARALGAGQALARTLARLGCALPDMEPREIARTLRETLLESVVQGGVEVALEFLRRLELASARLEQLRLVPISVSIDGADAGTPVELVWTSPGARWVLPGASVAAVGKPTHAIGLREGEAPFPKVSVSAFAHVGTKVFVGHKDDAEGDVVLSLVLGAPALVPWGDGVRQLPSGIAPLALEQTSADDAKRPLFPTANGGRLSRSARDGGGAYRVTGRWAGAEVAQARVELEDAGGVVFGDRERWIVKRGETLRGIFRGGEAKSFEIRAPSGRVLKTLPGGTLSLPVKLPDDRYTVTVGGGGEGGRGAPFAVGEVAARLTLVGSPHEGRALETAYAGQALFLRFDGWPAVLAEEVLAVRWQVGGARTTTTPLPGLPEAATLLPLKIAAQAKPGPRDVNLEVVTARGVLKLGGRVRVGRRAAEVPVHLLGLGGEELNALASGELALLRPARPLSSWALVGPRGARSLLARFDGQVPLRVDPEEPIGDYEVWGSGVGDDGEPAFARLAVNVYRVAELRLSAPQGTVGDVATLEASPPANFEAPFKVRVGTRPWKTGTKLDLHIQAENDLIVSLRDAKGRQARGRLRFKAEYAAANRPAVDKGPRFGIAANTDEERIFAAPYSLLTSYERNDNLPPNLAILELGPLTAAGVRERIFRTIPYDGSADGRQVAYRSERFWKTLQRSARERLLELGITEGEPFTVQNTPSPQGEYTLTDLVAQHRDANGGFTYRLIKVAVSADGDEPADTTSDAKISARMQHSQISRRGGAVRQVAVPGPLADLELVSALPETLRLDRTNRLSFSLVSRRKRLVQRPYPGGWEAVAAKALVSPELSVKLSFDGQELEALARGLDRDVSGVDVTLTFEHMATERYEALVGRPRKAEQQRLWLHALGSEPSEREVRFEPLTPGSLSNQPRELTIRIAGVQRRAVPASAWPAGRERPESVRIGGVPFLFQTEDVPEARIELVVTYLRAAPGAKVAPPEPKEALGSLLAGRGAREPASLTQALATAEAELGGRPALAESVARRALTSKPTDPRPWALLAEIALSAGRAAQARARARWSLDLGVNPRAWIVLGEAAFGDGDLEGAQQAVKALDGLDVPTPLQERYERLKEDSDF